MQAKQELNKQERRELVSIYCSVLALAPDRAGLLSVFERYTWCLEGASYYTYWIYFVEGFGVRMMRLWNK